MVSSLHVLNPAASVGWMRDVHVFVKFRLTPVINSSVYTITCVSFGYTTSNDCENLAYQAKVELHNAELAGKVQNFYQHHSGV